MPEDSEIFYIDETGFEEFYTREYGYAPRGKKIIGEVKGKKFTRTNVVSAKHNDKLIAPFAFSGRMDSSLFEGWLEEIFAKHLVKPQSSVIILDNASFHRKDAIYDIADEYGFRVIFLPPYSPDFNLIEQHWATIKRSLTFCMQSFSCFWDAIIHVFK